MFKRRYRAWDFSAVPAIAAVLISGALYAAPARKALIDLDPARTSIDFTLRGFPHTTTGSFKLKSGSMIVDPQTGAVRGLIVVDAASGATGIDMRDSEMKNRILDVQHYPEVKFVPRRAEFGQTSAADFTVRITGLMYLHGSPHEMTLIVAVHRNGDDLNAATRITIPYVKWGLENPSLLFLRVADEVSIEVRTAAHLTWTTVQ
jgi:polyisoprenoid-binding protein YceI